MNRNDSAHLFRPPDDITCETIGMSSVVQTILNRATRFVHVELPCEVLTVTPEHPFWVLGNGWVPAGELAAVKFLLRYDGKPIPIEDVCLESVEIPRPVFNLTTTSGTYWVGLSGVLVHNKVN